MKKTSRRKFIVDSLTVAGSVLTVQLLSRQGHAASTREYSIHMIGFFNHTHPNAEFIDNETINSGRSEGLRFGNHTHPRARIPRDVITKIENGDQQIQWRYLDHDVTLTLREDLF